MLLPLKSRVLIHVRTRSTGNVPASFRVMFFHVQGLRVFYGYHRIRVALHWFIPTHPGRPVIVILPFTRAFAILRVRLSPAATVNPLLRVPQLEFGPAVIVVPSGWGVITVAPAQ